MNKRILSLVLALALLLGYGMMTECLAKNIKVRAKEKNILLAKENQK